MNNRGLAGPTPVRGAQRVLYLTLGVLLIGIGALGVALPVLPTTPFLLLASYFLVRSSPRLHGWLLRSRVFGGFLRDWQQHRGVRFHVKITAIVMLIVAVTASALLANLSWPWLIALIVLALIGLIVILRLRTIRDHENL